MQVQVCARTSRHVESKPLTSSDTEADLGAAERGKLPQDTPAQDEGATRRSRGHQEQGVYRTERKNCQSRILHLAKHFPKVKAERPGRR